jgi:Relaxase/Mobilisation nuclease domain
MIVKVVPTGSNPGGLLKYLMDKDKEFELYGGNIAGTTYSEIMQQWRAISQLNPRTDKDTKHITLSLHHSDRLSPEQWLSVCEYMTHGLGYTNNLWLAIKHEPTPSQRSQNPDAQPHVHLMIHTFECVSGKFNRINDWQDKTRAEKLAREIEKQWNLYRVAPSQDAECVASSTGQLRRYWKETKLFALGEPNAQIKKQWLLSTGLPIWEYNKPQPIVKRLLQTICTEAQLKQSDLSAYIDSLQQHDISVKIAIIKGQPVGISYGKDGIFFAGSQLGKRFSWTGLQKQGYVCDPTDFKLSDCFREIEPSKVSHFSLKTSTRKEAIEQTQLIPEKQLMESSKERLKNFQVSQLQPTNLSDTFFTSFSEHQKPKNKYRQKYESLKEQAMNISDLQGIELDYAVGLVAVMESLPKNQIRKIIEQSDKVIDWKKSLSPTEYQPQTQKYIDKIIQICDEFKETVKQAEEKSDRQSNLRRKRLRQRELEL